MTEGGTPSHRRLYALIALMVSLWSLNFIIGKTALREFPALLAGGLRTALAGLLIWPIYRWEGRRGGHRWHASDLPTLLGLGLCGVAANQLFFLLGLSLTTVAHAAILMGMTPILVLTIAAITGQERLTTKKILGMAIALTGVAFLQRSNGGGPTLLGDSFVFLASLTFAVFTVFGKRKTKSLGSITVNTFAYIGGGIMLLPVTLWQGAQFSFSQVSLAGWASLFYMAMFPSVVCYLIYYYALTHIPASRVSAFSYLQPLLATVLAILLLGEGITGSLAGGGALVLAGVCVTERA